MLSNSLLLTCAVVLGGLVLFGCSGRIRTHLVSGRILSNGQPVGYANVVLHPIGENDLGPLRPRAQTDADGRFKLSTYGFEDGAPAGQYKVTVVWGTIPPAFAGWQLADIPAEELGSGPDYLQGRYETPEVTPLRVTITGNESELPTLEVQ